MYYNYLDWGGTEDGAKPLDIFGKSVPPHGKGTGIVPGWGYVGVYSCTIPLLWHVLSSITLGGTLYYT